MSYPALCIYLDRIRHNSAAVTELCRRVGVEVCAVTKGVCADLRVTRAMLDGGCKGVADSRMENLKRLKAAFPDVDRTLLRIPMKCELPDVVRYTACSLASTVEGLRGLDAECEAQNATHSVLLMADLGDRREGFLEGEREAFARTLAKLSHVRLRGVGVNFGCFAGVLPSRKALSRLCGLRGFFEDFLGYPVPLCSGGSTSTLRLIEKGELPEGVNGLRIGEAILLGQNVVWRRDIPWLRQDTMELHAQVVESRIKPSLPEGERGADAFGGCRRFEDEGERPRAIVAVGRQDFACPADSLTPLDKGIRVLGASSDHTILGASDAPQWGDVLRFSLDYGAMLGLMTSPYVRKIHRG